MEHSDQQRAVNAWLERVAARSVEELIRAFEAAFAALWKRTELTLGEVTLVAIVERVLHTAKEQYPIVAAIEATRSGLRCPGLAAQPGLRKDEVADAIRFVLVEFLTVLGNLTAQILSPALRAELARVHFVAEDQ